MILTDLIIYLLYSYGLTAIYMYSVLVSPVRAIVDKNNYLKQLTNCSMCLGFWVGLVNITAYHLFITPINIILIFPLAVASSGFTWLICSVTQAALWNKAYYEDEYKRNRKRIKL